MRPFYHEQARRRQWLRPGQECLTWHPRGCGVERDDAFVRPTARRGRQECLCGVSHVDADDGEIAVIKFPDVWAIFQSWSALAVGVRIRADAAEELHGELWFRVRNTFYLLSFWRQGDFLAKAACEEAPPRPALENLLRPYPFAKGECRHDATRPFPKRLGVSMAWWRESSWVSAGWT